MYMTDDLFRALCDEIDRIIDRYPESVEALEQIKWWAQEENIPYANKKIKHIDFLIDEVSTTHK